MKCNWCDEEATTFWVKIKPNEPDSTRDYCTRHGAWHGTNPHWISFPTREERDAYILELLL
jgi:hypothetical protein